MKDLGGIEPPKSFRNAGDSVPYDDIEQSDKLKFELGAKNPGGSFCSRRDIVFH